MTNLIDVTHPAVVLVRIAIGVLQMAVVLPVVAVIAVVVA